MQKISFTSAGDVVTGYGYPSLPSFLQEQRASISTNPDPFKGYPIKDVPNFTVRKEIT